MNDYVDSKALKFFASSKQMQWPHSIFAKIHDNRLFSETI